MKVTEAGTGQTGQGRRDRADGTGQTGQGRRDRADGTGQTGQGSRDSAARTEQPGQSSRDRAARTGQSGKGQDGEEKTPIKNNQTRTTKTGSQDSLSRTPARQGSRTGHPGPDD